MKKSLILATALAATTFTADAASIDDIIKDRTVSYSKMEEDGSTK